MNKTCQEIANAFMRGETAKGSSALWSTGDKLMSYDTCIAQWDGPALVLNKTKYRLYAP